MGLIDKDATLKAIADYLRADLADCNHYYLQGAQDVAEVVENMPERGRNGGPTMDDAITIMIDEDGLAEEYDDTYDVTIHCDTEEDQQKVIKDLRSRTWVPCSVRLPENDDKVLCCTATKKGTRNIVIGYYIAEREYWACGMNSNVIAWMPLPEPYKEAEE